MKLFFTQRSPFARKIRLLARLTDQISDIEEIETTVRDPDAPVLPHNPTGKVPTLVLDNGTALQESLLITSYLEERAGTRALNGIGDQRWPLSRSTLSLQQQLIMLPGSTVSRT